MKNRVHVDVYGDTNELLRRGATMVVRCLDGQCSPTEGNEFRVSPPTGECWCAVAPFGATATGVRQGRAFR